MILHPELFTYKALVSGLEITELILLQVNFNLSLYVLCNCYFKDPFSLTVMHRGRFVVSGTQKVAIIVSSFSGGEICFHLNSLFTL